MKNILKSFILLMLFAQIIGDNAAIAAKRPVIKKDELTTTTDTTEKPTLVGCNAWGCRR